MAAAADAADLAPVRAYIAVAQAADFKIDDQVRKHPSNAITVGALHAPGSRRCVQVQLA